MRLDKYVAGAAQQSRSDVRRAIQKGLVCVNGAVCRSADAQVPAGAAVTLNGQPLVLQQYVYIMLDKPKGVVSAAADKNDVTVVDLVGRAYPRRSLFPAGRLDKTSTGFVLVTDDGAFAHDILAPRRHVPKTYEVLLDTPLTPEMAAGFRGGRPAGGRAAAAARGAFAGAGRPVQRACGAAPGRVSSDQAHVRRIRRGRERAAAHGHRRPGAGRRAGAGRLPRAFARRGGAYPRRLENRKKFRAKCWKPHFRRAVHRFLKHFSHEKCTINAVFAPCFPNYTIK